MCAHACMHEHGDTRAHVDHLSAHILQRGVCAHLYTHSQQSGLQYWRPSYRGVEQRGPPEKERQEWWRGSRRIGWSTRTVFRFSEFTPVAMIGYRAPALIGLLAEVLGRGRSMRAGASDRARRFSLGSEFSALQVSGGVGQGVRRQEVSTTSSRSGRTSSIAAAPGLVTTPQLRGRRPMEAPLHRVSLGGCVM